jgi:NAD(P)-dependent dehydrogenase (short-subunit alcohol dehydrogenase family)
MTRGLEDRVAWVTGASRGIGRAIAVALARAGARVLCTGRSPDDLAATVKACGQGRAAALGCDVRRASELEAAAAAAVARWGRLDVLVNNAGISGFTPLDGPDAGPWADILDVNLTGSFLALRAAAPHLPSDGRGRVVNLSSVLGRFGVPGYAAYCASKHGVIGLTRAAALELGPRGITVNAVCPGWVDTDMAQTGFSGMARAMGITVAEARAEAAKMAPLDVILSPEDVAGLVLFLCGDAARNITGQAYNVCGGQTMD